MIFYFQDEAEAYLREIIDSFPTSHCHKPDSPGLWWATGHAQLVASAAADAADVVIAAAAAAAATETDKILNGLKMTKALTLAFSAASSCLAEGF